jgi:hypothetical protein
MTRNLALAISYCFAISVTASAQNIAPVVTTPIAPFTVYAGAPARSIDLTTAFADPDASKAVQLSVSLPSKHGHLHYCARRAAQTSHGRQFSELRKFRAVFRD